MKRWHIQALLTGWKSIKSFILLMVCYIGFFYFPLCFLSLLPFSHLLHRSHTDRFHFFVLLTFRLSFRTSVTICLAFSFLLFFLFSTCCISSVLFWKQPCLILLLGLVFLLFLLNIWSGTSVFFLFFSFFLVLPFS